MKKDKIEVVPTLHEQMNGSKLNEIDMLKLFRDSANKGRVTTLEALCKQDKKMVTKLKDAAVGSTVKISEGRSITRVR